MDNSRILAAATEVLKEGGLGSDLSDLPAVGAAPEWVTEKAIAIGHYFVGSGMYVVLGAPLHVTGGAGLRDFVTGGVEALLGGKFGWAEGPEEQVRMMLEHIERKRDALGINKKRERKLLGMKERRELDV